MLNFNRSRFWEFIIVDKRNTDLSLQLGTGVIRDKTTGLRSNENIYRDKLHWLEAVTALRKHKFKKCANIISKVVLDGDETKVIDVDRLRISDAYIQGPTCVIYQLKSVENDPENNSSNMAGTE